MFKLYKGDCLEIMENLIKHNIKVDAIISDIPYSKTKNKWDKIINFEKMWKNLKGIRKDNSPIILFGQGVFTAKLILSNEKEYKYTLIWDKVHPSGFLNSKKRPLSSHEDICVFYKKAPVYNPQKFEGKKNNSNGKNNKIVSSNNYNSFVQIDNRENYGNLKFPKSILSYQKPHPSVALHPTQKPLELFEYLIKTYTNEGDTILDFTMGSGTTGVACKKLNRNFIGIEIEDKYFSIASNRIENFK